MGLLMATARGARTADARGCAGADHRREARARRSTL